MDDEENQQLMDEIKVLTEHIERVTNKCGPEVVKAMNDSLSFMEDYFLGEGCVTDVPYVPRNKQGNQRYTAISSDPEVIATLRRSALAVARFEALHVPNLSEQQQSNSDHHFLAHENIALRKALGDPPIPRFPSPKLTRSMTQARLLELAVKAAEGLVEPSWIKVEAQPGSLRKLRGFVVQFGTRSELLVLVGFDFEGLSIWSSAVALTLPGRMPLPLLMFMSISPASEFAWDAAMPAETRIACYLKVIATFAAQI